MNRSEMQAERIRKFLFMGIFGRAISEKLGRVVIVVNGKEVPLDPRVTSNIDSMQLTINLGDCVEIGTSCADIYETWKTECKAPPTGDDITIESIANSCADSLIKSELFVKACQALVSEGGLSSFVEDCHAMDDAAIQGEDIASDKSFSYFS